MEKSDKVTITLKEYEELLDCDLMLRCLENAGVYNWTWYDEAMEEYRNLRRLTNKIAKE